MVLFENGKFFLFLPHNDLEHCVQAFGYTYTTNCVVEAWNVTVWSNDQRSASVHNCLASTIASNNIAVDGHTGISKTLIKSYCFIHARGAYFHISEIILIILSLVFENSYNMLAFKKLVLTALCEHGLYYTCIYTKNYKCTFQQWSASRSQKTGGSRRGCRCSGWDHTHRRSPHCQSQSCCAEK